MIPYMKNYTGNMRLWQSRLALAAIAFLVLGTALEPTSANFALFPSESPESGSVALAPQQGSAPALPTPSERWTGDFDGMIKRRKIRALVVYSRSAFFYDQGWPKGISYEALQEFQQTLNRDFKTGSLPVSVTFLPVGYEQLEQALISGMGDLWSRSLLLDRTAAQ